MVGVFFAFSSVAFAEDLFVTGDGATSSGSVSGIYQEHTGDFPIPDGGNYTYGDVWFEQQDGQHWFFFFNEEGYTTWVLSNDLGSGWSDHFVIVDSNNTFPPYETWTGSARGNATGTPTVAGVQYGCTDEQAENYDSLANQEDGTCEYAGLTGALAGGLFYGRGEDGKSKATELITNDLTASVGSTTKSLGPVLAIVGGIILAFIVTNWIIGLLNETKPRKKEERRKI